MADSRTTKLCQEVVAQYLGSLREEFAASDSEFGCTITTPFMRPDGDYLALIAERRPDGRVMLSDGGETFAYLFLSGIALSRKLQEDARRIGARFGVEIDVNELVAVTEDDHLGEAVHGLVQAAMNVAALIEKRRPYMNLKFDESVEAVIIGHGKRYDPDYAVDGAKEPHNIRFRVDSGMNLLIQPLSQPNATQARRLAERWNYYFTDIQKKNESWSCVAVLDDRGERAGVWNPYVTTPLEGVATLLRWGRDRERFDALLGGERLSA